jgi:hypothetical protein
MRWSLTRVVQPELVAAMKWGTKPEIANINSDGEMVTPMVFGPEF